MAIHDVTETLEIQNTSLRSLKQKTKTKKQLGVGSQSHFPER